MTPLDFAWKHVGDVLTAPGGLGGECVDLANLWLLEAFRLPHVFANAKDWEFAAIKGFSWVRNTPTNVPSAGDLVVWGPEPAWGIGANGHIALCLVADVNHLLSLDQNWPEKSPVAVKFHDYRGVLGWQHRA